MLRAIKIVHIRSMNKIFRFLHIATADSPAPIRSRIMPVRLQDPLFPRDTATYSGTDIADRDRECAFPGWTLGAWVTPLLFKSGLGAIARSVGVVVVSGYIVGV